MKEGEQFIGRTRFINSLDIRKEIFRKGRTRWACYPVAGGASVRFDGRTQFEMVNQ